MRTAGVGPPRPPTPAAALPHGDFTRRRQEGVRPENQQVRGFPRPSQLFPASRSGRPGRGGRPGCGSGGGTAPPRQTAVAWSHLPAPDSWASPAAAAAARCRPALGRVPAARLLRRAATLGASRRPSAGPGSRRSRVRFCDGGRSDAAWAGEAGCVFVSSGGEETSSLSPGACSPSALSEQAPSLLEGPLAGGGAEGWGPSSAPSGKTARCLNRRS